MKKIRKLIRKLLPKLGLHLYTATAIWPHDQEFKQAVADIPVKKGGPPDRGYTLFKLARASAGLPGDMAECGCLEGGSSRFLLAGTGKDTDKTLHIFDSFEGLSEPTSDDKTSVDKVAWNKGSLTSSEALLRENLKAYADMISIHKGWIPDRFSDVADKTFSMVHIDVDLFEPTMDCLEFFYDKMAPGGVIICDDYGSKSCPGAKKAFDDFFANRPEVLIEMPTIQALVIKA